MYRVNKYPETGGEREVMRQKIKRMMKVPGRKENPYNVEQRRIGRERALQAMELRTAGVSYTKIAESIGYSSQSSAKRAIDRYMAHQIKDASINVIETDLARMDEYIQRCTHSLRQNGDLSQIDRLLRIQDAKYRLLGISDEALRTVREANGITTQVTNNAQVMIVTASKNSEEEFLKKMMEAAGVDPKSQDAVNYIEKKITLLPRKEIEGRKKKKRIIRRPNKNKVYATAYTDLGEEEIIDATIV